MTRLVLCIAAVAFVLFIVGGSVLMAFGVSAMREFAAVVSFFAVIVWLVIKANEAERRAAAVGPSRRPCGVCGRRPARPGDFRCTQCFVWDKT